MSFLGAFTSTDEGTR
jgi:hypothetical protein